MNSRDIAHVRPAQVLTVQCIDNTDAEDQLTLGANYQVLATGLSGFLLADDNGEESWHRAKFFRFNQGGVNNGNRGKETAA